MVLGAVFITVTQAFAFQGPAELMHTEYYTSSAASSSSCITAPVIICPSLYFGCPGDDTSPDVTGLAVALPGDSNCPDPVVTFADTIISMGPCDGAIEIHRLWTAVYPDNSNPFLYADCTQLVLLEDTEGPTIHDCPMTITVPPNENCEAVVTWTSPTATDDCGLDDLVSDYQSGDTFPHGITTVTYTATDFCGNTTSCSFHIVVDGRCCFDAPVISCPDAVTDCPSSDIDPDVTGYATAVAGSEFCEEAIITYVDNVVSVGPCDGATQINRIWTATDPENGDLQPSCTQVITLEDTSHPVISNIPTDITLAPNADCEAVATWTTPAATDNCGVASLTSNYASGATFTEGTTTVTYTAVDHCGQSTEMSFTVTVTDCCTSPPVITCPSAYTDCPGESTEPSNTGTATAVAGSEFCESPTVTYSDDAVSTGPCDGATVIHRTWTATDPDNDNLASSCTQVIILEDTSNPVISNMPANITLAPDGDCEAVATWTTPAATDNCGVASFTSNHASGATFTEGTTTVTYTAVDHFGQSTEMSFTVTVTDCCTSPPVITCPSAYTDCPGESTEPSITGTATAVAGSEFCESSTVTYSDVVISTGPCTGATVIHRTWTATDPDNDDLASSCTQVITLEDTEPPVVTDCPDDITVTTTTGSAVVTWSGPNSTDNCNLEWLMGDYTSGDTFTLGSTLVTFTAVDDCENVTLCTFTVTVVQTETSCQDDIVVSCAGGEGTVVTWDLPEFDFDCPDCNQGDSISGFLYMGSLNGSSYYCSTTQAASPSASAIAASHGGHLATITSQQENDLLEGFLMNQCALIGYTDIASEGNFLWSNGEPAGYSNWAPGQPNNYNGNQDCTVLCQGGWYDEHCSITHEFIMEISCVTYTQTTGQPNGSLFSVGTDTITYQINDLCGNTRECSFMVTVENSLTLDCPNDLLISCGYGQSGSYVQWDTPTLNTCCDICAETYDEIPGYMYMGYHNGSKYYCSLQPASWPYASAAVNVHGGYLAKVNNVAENAFLANLLTIQRAWIGLSDVTTEGTFVWQDGSSPTYDNWYLGQPNNKNNYQDYVSMLNNGQWNDEYNDLAMEYIMEISCSQVTQIAGPTNGSLLPIGTTTVTYAGSDGCGGTDTCSFNIQVSAPTSCPSYGLDTWYMWIEHIGLGDYNNASGNNDGYADFTSEECIEVTAGAEYPITLTPGFSGSLYTVYWKVWIDYNHDGDYLDDNEFVAYGTGHNQLTGTLPVSPYCISGETTMRIVMKYGAYPSGPCAVFQHGEVEDYCINITHGDLNGKDQSGDSRSTIKAVELVTSLTVTSELPSDDLLYNALTQEDENVKSEMMEDNITVYPNPVRDDLVIELGRTEALELVLMDMTGKVVNRYNLEFNTGIETISIGHVKDGIYFLKSIDGKYSKKVIVQR